MKPNVLKISSLLIMVIIMCVRITSTQANQCGCNVSFYFKDSQRFLWINKTQVQATSDDKQYQFFIIHLPTSTQFFMYDMHVDRFICTNTNRNNKTTRLVSRKFPPKKEHCLFEEIPSNVYVKYINPFNDKYMFRFSKSGFQMKHRHKHFKNSNMQFLPKKTRHQCGEKKKFCKKMEKRKRLLPELRTFCGIDEGVRK